MKRIGIVASKFNSEYVDGLVSAAMEELKGVETLLVRVPGAFEIPLAVQRMIRLERPQAVIALGLIWQGATEHADLIASEVTSALMRVSLDNDVPVIHQVLLVRTEKQARERCFGKTLNRGREAAEAALELVHHG